MLTTNKLMCQAIGLALALSIAGVIDCVPLVHYALKCILKVSPGLLRLRLHMEASLRHYLVFIITRTRGC